MQEPDVPVLGKPSNRGSIAGMNSGRERVERRLAAVLAADVAGYSRLMGADEEGTHAALTALRREVLDPKIAEHRGRVVKTTGDGLLVEFASAVDVKQVARELGMRYVLEGSVRKAQTRVRITGQLIEHRHRLAYLGRPLQRRHRPCACR